MKSKEYFGSVKSQFDPGILIVLAICLLAIWPFLSRAALPQATDAELHVFRLAELSRLVRAGEIYPRWAPNFYFGYGYPIFNYYAPLTYYLGLIFDFMPIVGPVEAVKALFILGLILGGVSMYGYARRLWGTAAGIIAATAYTYAPYILFIDPHARGDLAEAFSFALFPLALWTLDRLRTQITPLNWLVAVLAVAAIILTHNLMAMVLFALLLSWVIWQAVIGEMRLPEVLQPSIFNRLLQFRLLFALLMGIGISAFFWLVVALEQDAVNLSSLVGDGGHFDFRNHFLSPLELLAPSRIMDWGATQPDYALSLGVVQWLLGVLGVIVALFVSIVHRRQAVFFAIASISLISLMMPISSKIWELVPYMEFLQFPWRLLGAEAAVLAIMAGVAAAGILGKLSLRRASWSTAMIVAVIVVSALPLLETPPWPADFGATNISRVLNEELSGRWLGTTSTADFVPSTVDIIPRPQDTMVTDMMNGRVNDRVNRATLAASTTVNSLSRSPLETRYFVTSEDDFLLRLHLFDFPGWKVTIDGDHARTELARPEGFIVIPVPAGEHIVEVKFGSTPARNIAMLISVVSIAISLLFAIMLATQPAGIEYSLDNNPVPKNVSFGPILIVVSLLFLVTVLIIQPRGLLRFESQDQRVEVADFQSNVSFGNQIALIGYDLSRGPVEPGDELSFIAYWKSLQPIDINYQVFAHLMDDDNNLITQSDKLNPGEFPTKRWPADKYIQDKHQVLLPEDLPPGEYRWSIGLWVANEGWRLPLLGEDGIQEADSFIIPESILVE